MMVHGLQVRRVARLLLILAALNPAYSSRVQASDAPNTVLAGLSEAQPSAHTTLLDRIGRLISSIFPMEEYPGADDAGGLFGGDGTTIAWGGSTLEVVKTQATYLTKAATFGPRITSDEGLRGGLLPVSDFYHSKDPSSSSTAVENHGCPYKGGPGWRDEDFDDPDNNDSFWPAEEVSQLKTARPPQDWIALVERGGHCAFAAKVRVAQALGAKAVVVGDAPSPEYDDGDKSPGEQSDPGQSGRLVTMYAPGNTSDIQIPSTFITRPSYVDLIRLIDEMVKEGEDRCFLRKKEGKQCDSREEGLEVILGRDDVMWEWPLIDLAFILLLLPSFMTLATIIIHRIRLTRQRRRERAPEVVVLGLPCLIWRPNGQPWEKVEGSETGVISSATSKSVDGASKQHNSSSDDMELGDTQADNEDGAQAGPSSTVLKTTPILPPVPIRQHSYLPPGRTYYSCDECAICLSEFVDGDHVRVLPCGHVFHLPEIDSWLLRVKKLCPICKRDITVPVPPTPPAPFLHNAATPTLAADESPNDGSNLDDEEHAAETSPLLVRPS